MRILYDLRDGAVIDNSGTSSARPLGPPDDDLRNVPEGFPRRLLATVRLHDVDDAELVAEILTNRHHVDPDTGQVVIDGPYPPADESDPEPTADDRLAVLEEAVADATGRTVAELRSAAVERARARREAGRPTP